MLLTNDELNKPMSIINTRTNLAPPKKFPREKFVTNKMPVELSYDISNLFSDGQLQNLLYTLKTAQKIVDEGFDPLNKTTQYHGMVYHKEAGLVTDGYETWYKWDPDSVISSEKGYHSISFMRAPQITNKIGYCFDHAIYDSFGIYSRLAEILKIDESEFFVPYSNLLDITHLKSNIMVPWAKATASDDLDLVQCQISLSGETILSARTTPRSVENEESYSEKLSSTKLTAFNPYILSTRTTETEDTYLLTLRFNTMTFTRLLELANSK